MVTTFKGEKNCRMVPLNKLLNMLVKKTLFHIQLCEGVRVTIRTRVRVISESFWKYKEMLLNLHLLSRGHHWHIIHLFLGEHL